MRRRRGGFDSSSHDKHVYILQAHICPDGESEGVSRRMIRTGWLSFVERLVCEKISKKTLISKNIAISSYPQWLESYVEQGVYNI